MTTTSAWLALGWTFLHVLWLGLIVGLIAAMLRRLLRRAAPEARHNVALACLMVLAITPFVVFAVVHRPVTTAKAVAVEPIPADGITFRGGGQTFYLDPPPSPSIPTPPAPPRGSWIEPTITVLPGVWLVGSLLTLGSLATGLVGVERLRWSSVPLESGPIADRLGALVESLGIARRVGVAVCDRIAAPMLIGVVRPLILLPSSALSGWSADQIEMALLHELAHLRRWDNLVNLLRRLVESLLFFHPVTWWLSAWVRLEREVCCDRLVVDRMGKPREYARWLAELAGCDLGRGHLASALNERPLTTRIRRILNMEDRSMKLALPEVLALGAVAILGAALALPSLADSPKSKGDDEAKVALARLSVSAAATPSDGESHQRSGTLLKIAKAQIKLGDRAGALVTLNHERPIALPRSDAEVDRASLERLFLALEIAEARHRAGDAPGALAQFRLVSDWLMKIGLVVNDENIARLEKIFAQDPLPAGDGSDQDGLREAVGILERKLGVLGEIIEKLIELGEPAEARPMVAHLLNLIEPMDAPLKQVMGAEVGRVLIGVGEVDRGREAMAQSRKALLERSVGDSHVLDVLGPMMDTADPSELDDAMTLIGRLKPEAQRDGARLMLQVLGEDEKTTNWLDSGVIKITIGDPSLAPRDKAVARVALPKLADLIRSWDDAKAQARSLAVVAHLQARADDIAGALETAESIPEVRRADDPGPNDGFYDAIKPATFALIAAVQADAGDQNGASASFAKSKALTAKVEAEDQKLIAQIVLSDKLVSTGRVAEAREILAEAFPLAATQPEPRRSRALCMLVENQVKAGDLDGASKNIETIRDDPGIQKARALQSLARALQDKGDAEAAAKAARRGLEYLAKTKQPFGPGSIPNGANSPRIARDTFIDYDQESHPVLVSLSLQTMPSDLRVLAGESEELLQEANALHPFQRDNVIGSVLHDATRREGLEQALKRAEALEAPDARLAAIDSLVREIERGR